MHTGRNFELQEEEDEPPEVKYIDSAEFQNFNASHDSAELILRWTDSFETEEKKLHRLLVKFIALLAGKHATCFRIIEKYASALHYQGAEVVQTGGDGRFRRMSSAAARSVGSTANLPLVLKSISDITRQVNLAQYLSTVLASVGQNRQTWGVLQKTEYRERLGSLHLFHIGYRQGLETLLSNSRLLRNFRQGAIRRRDRRTDHILKIFTERDLFTQVPAANGLALQTVLEDWNCELQDEKIVQLAHSNTLQMRSLHVKGDGLYFLNEALNCALALNYTDAQGEIDTFDSILTSNSTNARGRELFQLWRMISKYERSRRAANPQSFIATAERLENDCNSEGIGAGCSVMIETACKIRKRCDQQHDQITKVISDTVTRHPSLGPRMMQLAERCEVGYENDALLQKMCDLESNSCLHPSELTWLEHVERLVKDVGKFGSVRTTLEKSLKIMFEFLDFDSNRFNEKAWILMEKVLEFSDPSFVSPEWKCRHDWWSIFHRSKARDGRKLRKEVANTKEAVLKALEDIIV